MAPDGTNTSYLLQSAAERGDTGLESRLIFRGGAESPRPSGQGPPPPPPQCTPGLVVLWRSPVASRALPALCAGALPACAALKTRGSGGEAAL